MILFLISLSTDRKKGGQNLVYQNRKEVIYITKIMNFLKKRLSSQIGQSTLEYALVTVVAGIISTILIAVGKPMIVDLISKAFAKIADMV